MAVSGEKVTLPKREITQIEEAKTWVMAVYHARWYLAGVMGLAVMVMTWRWLTRSEFKTWMSNTWDFGKMIAPLLFGG
ncbi:MAG: permease, partial [Desulfobacterales bacterium]|nr:permease [Desulfobacterales bacterium]